MWCIITFAVCFMLACVMLISGNGSIGEVKDSIQDTIIVKEIDVQLEKRALSYYSDAESGLTRFDELFAQNASDTFSVLVWCSQSPNQADSADMEGYAQAVNTWRSAMPEPQSETSSAFAQSVSQWLQAAPAQPVRSSRTSLRSVARRRAMTRIPRMRRECSAA